MPLLMAAAAAIFRLLSAAPLIFVRLLAFAAADAPPLMLPLYLIATLLMIAYAVIISVHFITPPQLSLVMVYVTMMAALFFR